MYKEQGDRVQTAEVMHRLADVYVRFIDPRKAKQIHVDRVEVLKPLGDESWIPALEPLARTCATLGEHKEALVYLLQCLRYYERTIDSTGINGLLYDLARTYRILHDYERSIYYFKRNIRRDSLTGNMLSVIRQMGQVIEMYREQYNQDQARRYAAQVIDLFHRYSDSSLSGLIPTLAFSYRVVGEYEKAEYWLLKILPQYEEPPVNLGGLSELYQIIGELYITMKQYDRARFFLKKALSVNEKRGVPELATLIHLELFKADSMQGKLSSALWHYQQATLIKDSLFNETKNKQLEELQIQYDTEKKENRT